MLNNNNCKSNACKSREKDNSTLSHYTAFPFLDKERTGPKKKGNFQTGEVFFLQILAKCSPVVKFKDISWCGRIEQALFT